MNLDYQDRRKKMIICENLRPIKFNWILEGSVGFDSMVCARGEAQADKPNAER
jgi:hypothetical protein